MMKIAKFFFSAALIALLLLVTAVIVLPQFIDPNDYKQEITQLIQEKAGLEVTLEGELSLSVFPWLGVSTGKVIVNQPKAISQAINNAAPIADIAAVDVKVKLKPLFSRKIEADTIIVKQPKITLITTKTGINSLQGINPSTSNGSNSAPDDNANAGGGAIAAFTIAGINIDNGHLVIDDRQQGLKQELRALNITSGDLLNNSAAPLAISGIFSSTTLTPVTFSMTTQLDIKKESLHVIAKNTLVTVEQALGKVTAKIATIDYQHPATAVIKALAINGSAKLNLDNTATTIPANITIPAINVDIKQSTMNIPNMVINALEVELVSKLVVKNWDTMPLVSGNLQTSTFDANRIMKTVGIDYQASNAKSLTRIAVMTDINATAQGASLQNLDIGLDNSVLQGDISVVDFDQPAYRFDLSLDKIVVDDYLPTPDAAQANNKDQPISATEALAAPIALLDGVNANGVFRAGSIKASGIQLNNAVVTIHSDQQNVVVKPQVDLYDGTLIGTVTLRRAQNPTLSIVSTLSNVNLEPLLIDADITDQFSGIGNVITDITVTQLQGKPSSKGTIKLSAKNGAVKGIDIKKILDNGQNTIDQLRGKSVANPATNNTEDQTRFAAITATLLLNNDIVSNDDLYAEAPASRISGKGTANLATQLIDYVAFVKVVNTNSGQGGQRIDDLKGVTIPVSITGPFDNPKITPDYSAALTSISQKLLSAEKDKLNLKLAEEKARAKEKIEAEKESVKQQLKEKAAKELNMEKDSTTEELKKQLLKKLFR